MSIPEGVKDIRSIIIGEPLENVDQFQNFDTSTYKNSVLVAVENVGVFLLDKNSSAAVDNLRIISAIGGGRWINISPYDAIPQLNTSARTALTKVAGLTVDDTDLGTRFRCDGQNWIQILDADSSADDFPVLNQNTTGNARTADNADYANWAGKLTNLSGAVTQYGVLNWNANFSNTFQFQISETAEIQFPTNSQEGDFYFITIINPDLYALTWDSRYIWNTADNNAPDITTQFTYLKFIVGADGNIEGSYFFDNIVAQAIHADTASYADAAGIAANANYATMAINTAANSVNTASIEDGAVTAAKLDQAYLPLAGGTLTGNLILNANPTAPLGAATQQYVDAGDASRGPSNAGYIIKTSNSSLTNAQVLGSLSTGLMKVTTVTGVISNAVAGTDYLSPAAVGTTIQAYNANTTTQGNSVTGSGNIVLATSPTLTTPNIGAATATSLSISGTNNASIDSNGKITSGKLGGFFYTGTDNLSYQLAGPYFIGTATAAAAGAAVFNLSQAFNFAGIPGNVARQAWRKIRIEYQGVVAASPSTAAFYLLIAPTYGTTPTLSTTTSNVNPVYNLNTFRGSPQGGWGLNGYPIGGSSASAPFNDTDFYPYIIINSQGLIPLSLHSIQTSFTGYIEIYSSGDGILNYMGQMSAFINSASGIVYTDLQTGLIANGTTNKIDGFTFTNSTSSSSVSSVAFVSNAQFNVYGFL